MASRRGWQLEPLETYPAGDQRTRGLPEGTPDPNPLWLFGSLCTQGQDAGAKQAQLVYRRLRPGRLTFRWVLTLSCCRREAHFWVTLWSQEQKTVMAWAPKVLPTR